MLSGTEKIIEITGNISTKWVNEDKRKYSSRYSRMDQVKFEEDSFKFFKGCLPQILLGPFLYSLTHLIHNG